MYTRDLMRRRFGLSAAGIGLVYWSCSTGAELRGPGALPRRVWVF